MARPIKLAWRNRSDRGILDEHSLVSVDAVFRAPPRTDLMASVLAEIMDVPKSRVYDIAIMAMMERLNARLVEMGEKPIDTAAWSEESRKNRKVRKNEWKPLAKRKQDVRPSGPG